MISQRQSEVEEKLNSLQTKFKRTLPEKIIEIEKLWNSIVFGEAADSSMTDCYRLVHTLAGTGGTFGAVVVTTASQEIIQAFKLILETENSSSDLKEIITVLIQKLKIAANDWQPSKLPYFQPLIEKRKGNLIYLIDEDEAFAKDLITYLEQDDFIVKCFFELDSFNSAFHKEVPSAIIMNVIFKEGKINNTDAIEKLREEFNGCPPIIFISDYNAMDARLAALKAGAQRYFPKPLNTTKLSKTLDSLIERTEATPFRILFIDDDVSILKYYETVLLSAGLEVKTISNPMQSLQAIDVLY